MYLKNREDLLPLWNISILLNIDYSVLNYLVEKYKLPLIRFPLTPGTLLHTTHYSLNEVKELLARIDTSDL